MKLYALLGSPIAGSLSPQLHQAGFAASEVDAQYRLWPTTLAEVDARLVDAAAHLQGFNVTQPLKRAVLPHLKTLTARARTVGAVNTVRVHEGLLHGDNTDIVGVERSVEALAPQCGAALVLGSGGVAGAVLHVLHDAGFSPLVVAARREEQVTAWAQHLGLPLVYRPWVERHRPDQSLTLVVQATPLGGGDSGVLAMDLGAWSHGPAVLDLVVKPWGQTPLIKQAQGMGLRALDGRLMLVEQAIAAQACWALGLQGASAMRRVVGL